MNRKRVELEDLKREGIDITQEQYDELAITDCACGCCCSVYETLKVLKILKLI